MSDELNKAMVLKFYEEFDLGNLDEIVAILDPNFTAYLPGKTESLNCETFKPFAINFRSAFPDLKHHFEDVIIAGDKVITRGTFTGTHLGSLEGLPPTGKQITVTIMHIDRVVDGKLVEHWGQADTVGMLQQLGVVPLPIWLLLKIVGIAIVLLGLIAYFTLH